MKVMGGGSIHLLYALLIVLHMPTSIVSNSTTVDDGVRCIKSERQALLAFKQGLVDEYGWLSSWSSEEEKKDCCKWEGVQCSKTTGHIIVLNLAYDDIMLRGNLSPSLFELQHLISLDLSWNNFNLSHISESIGSLNKIKHLNLYFCNLSGSLPSQLGNLTSLQHLDLRYNKFNVENLEWLSYLSSLAYLGLSGNDLSKVNNYWLQEINKLPHLINLSLCHCNLRDIVPQSFPVINTSSTSLDLLHLGGTNLTTSTFQWLFNLSNNLVSLYLCYNQFQGPIPKAFGHMVFLEELDLAGNQFEGEIPKFFGSGNLSSLRILSLSNNRLSGTIPEDVGILSKLEALYISNNKLSGTLPKSIGLLSKLKELDISSNSFNGVVTEAHFSTPSKLEYLDMSFNSLSINFSRDWIPPFQLKYILLGSCKLGPDFPSWLQTQRNYYLLNMSASGISDSIPIWFGDLPSTARVIDLSSNHINGVLPDLSRKFSFDSFPLGIDLSGNHLEGPLPSFPANTTHINLSKNRFNGSISSLCAMTGMSLEFIDLSSNQLLEELPDCMMHWSSLQILNLANNHFYGKIPSFMGSFSLIETLDLQDNNFSGNIPSSLRNCNKLQFLGLNNNRLFGIIPGWIGEISNSLNFLLLKSNHLVGEVPLEICLLTNILLLDLSNNNLSGRIPWCIGNLTALARKDISAKHHFFESLLVSNGYYDFDGSYADKASVVWKGIEYPYENLTLQRTIDFSSNKLTGEIPMQIVSFFELHQLNLSKNHLTGRIPPNIGKMRQLESLDLSHNRLSGWLPPSMSQLYSLSKLDLSYNNFSGRIPSSTQLQSLPASAFVGNPALCGPPLPQTCPSDPKPINGGVEYSQQDEDEFWKRFKPSMEIGMAFGFVGVLALKLDHPWKHVCFRLFNYMKVHLSNLKDYLFLIVVALCLVITVNVARLRRKLKI